MESLKRYQVAIISFAAGIFTLTFIFGFLLQRQGEQEIPLPTSTIEETVKIKVFFSSTREDPKEMYCNKTYPVEREVFLQSTINESRLGELAYLAVKELLKGPTEQEKRDGFFISINPSTKVQKITIIKGVAAIDFNDILDKNVAGSCKVQAIRSEITETLKQFSEIKNVVILVNGSSEDILQP